MKRSFSRSSCSRWKPYGLYHIRSLENIFSFLDATLTCSSCDCFMHKLYSLLLFAFNSVHVVCGSKGRK